MSLLATVGSFAARALSLPFEVAQPDGTELTLILNGDEHMSWLTTTDGVMLVESNKSYYVASITDDGVLKATKQLAHNTNLRAASEQQLCRQQQARHRLFYNKADQQLQAARRAQVATDGGYCLHEGSPRVLVILANFSDVKFVTENPQETFNNLCNAETLPKYDQQFNNLCSLRRYFQKSSGGKFTPQLDVVGPIDLPQTMVYYGGSAEDSSTDANFDQFCKDAIAAVDGTVDFNLYDNDGDGKAELVCVIFAGYGQNITGNNKDTIWPKCGRQNIATGDNYTKDTSKKVVVNFMNCGAELFHITYGNTLGALGTFIHEFSHGMGLPDLYATVTSAQINNQTPEYWDLMDYGEHANNGYAPVPYTAWEQEAMGWIEVEKLENTQNVTEMLPLVKGGKAYKFGNGANENEWIYLENVQPRDNDNQIPGFAYGHGLLATHIAYASSKVNMYDYPNNTADKPRVCVVPADGLVINGYLNDGGYTLDQYKASLKTDPFPSTYKKDESTVTVTALTADMGLPNYKFYKGEPTPKQSLTNITESEGAISFTFNDGETTAISEKGKVKSEKLAPAAVYDLSGRKINSQFSIINSQLPKGLYIMNGRKVVIK